MKKHLFISLLLFAFVLSLPGVFSAQRGHHRHPHRHAHKKAVVRRSVYRPAKVVVFHPVWRPKFAYHRRWVFWPKYNLYWDNWRNHYVYLNGAVWISQPTPPPTVVNVNLSEEKHRELKEDEDDIDDVYKNNDNHKSDDSSEEKK